MGGLFAREFARDPVGWVLGLEGRDLLGVVPIVNVPAGTQTCCDPERSVRSCPAVVPSDGTGVGTSVGTTDGGTEEVAVGARLSEATGGADVADATGVEEPTAPPQPATTNAARRTQTAPRDPVVRSRNIDECYPPVANRHRAETGP